MPFYAGVKTVTVIHVVAFKMNVEDIDVIGVGKTPIVDIFLQHVSEYRIIDIPYFCMELFSSNAIFSVTFVNRVRIQPGRRIHTIIRRMIQKVFTGYERPYNDAAPEATPLGIPQPIDGRDARDMDIGIFCGVGDCKNIQSGTVLIFEENRIGHGSQDWMHKHRCFPEGW